MSPWRGDGARSSGWKKAGRRGWGGGYGVAALLRIPQWLQQVYELYTELAGTQTEG